MTVEKGKRISNEGRRAKKIQANRKKLQIQIENPVQSNPGRAQSNPVKSNEEEEERKTFLEIDTKEFQMRVVEPRKFKENKCKQEEIPYSN